MTAPHREGMKAAAKRAGFVPLSRLYVTEAELAHIINIAERHRQAIADLRAELDQRREWDA